MTPDSVVEEVVRSQYPRILATLIRGLGDVDDAEDALQDAVATALARWPVDGIPRSPDAWLITVARRRAIDRRVRESRRVPKEEAAMQAWWEPADPIPESVVRDDLLRLVFTCCHPSLSAEAQVALALRTLGGLTTAEVARALLVPEATMAKRLTRAKEKIRLAGIPYRVPSDEELPSRLPAVLATVYLVFNEGYAASTGSSAVRTDLVAEAIRLGRLLRDLMPDEPSVAGLLGLMLLHDSRRATRVDDEGTPVPLAEQDRAQWDAAAIDEGTALVAEGLRRTPDRPDPFVVQGAIAACHALAPRWADTDWDALVAWYDVLLTIQDGPAARLGRAAVVAERDGPEARLREIDAIGGMDGSAWWHASRAELLFRMGRDGEARTAADRATSLGLNDAHTSRLLRSRDSSGGGTMAR